MTHCVKYAKIWLSLTCISLANGENLTGEKLCEKCPNTEFFLVRIFPYSVQMLENMDQKISVFGQFSRSESGSESNRILTYFTQSVIHRRFHDVFIRPAVFNKGLVKMFFAKFFRNVISLTLMKKFNLLKLNLKLSNPKLTSCLSYAYCFD